MNKFLQLLGTGNPIFVDCKPAQGVLTRLEEVVPDAVFVDIDWASHSIPSFYNMLKANKDKTIVLVTGGLFGLDDGEAVKRYTPMIYDMMRDDKTVDADDCSDKFVFTGKLIIHTYNIGAVPPGMLASGYTLTAEGLHQFTQEEVAA